MEIQDLGLVLSFALAVFGATIGCYISGTKAYRLYRKIKKEKEKLIIVSLLPSFNIVYGYMLMVLLNQNTLLEVTSIATAITIGLSAGLVFMFVGIFQGQACLRSIQAIEKHPELFGRSFIRIAIIETFSLIAFCIAVFFM